MGGDGLKGHVAGSLDGPLVVLLEEDGADHAGDGLVREDAGDFWAALARLASLSPYSPDFNPIEMAFAKRKALRRKAAERTVDGLWTAIGRLVDVVTPQECATTSRPPAMT
jgi:transposase